MAHALVSIPRDSSANMQSGYGAVPGPGAEGEGGGPLRDRDDDEGDAAHGAGGRLRRHLSLFDLVCVGVGATVGSGVFVLVGLIARTQAGPGVSASWLVAGIAACASGLCYAEMGGRYPSAGSSYVYARETMGEGAAIVAGACLTLEYTGSASAVARSWGDKVVAYVGTRGDDDDAGDSPWRHRLLTFALDPGFGISPPAFLVSSASVFLLLGGVRESKAVTNVFSALNVSLVLFMAVASLALVRGENMTPFVPPEFGVGGLVRGATSSFFGYIGFDEICCISGEAIDPTRNVPRAIVVTLLVVTVLYCSASVGLAGMVPYQDISETSGFPEGFRYRGYNWAAEITAIGELTVLPLVVLVTIMAQPRLNYTMAADGYLPPVFAEVDGGGNLRSGTRIAGAVMVAVATVVPFARLDDLISSGILVAFTMTDASVILVRRTSPPDDPRLLGRMLAAFLVASLLAGFLLRSCLSAGTTGNAVRAAAALACVAALGIGNGIRRRCPNKKATRQRHGDEPGAGLFLTPFVPILPLCGCFVNLYLIAQLETTGLVAIFGYVGLAVLFYTWQKRRRQHRIEPPGRTLSLQEAH